MGEIFTAVSLFFSGSPVGRFLKGNALKLIIGGLVVAALVFAGWFVVHEFEKLETSLAATQQQLGKALEENKQMKQQVANLQDQLQRQVASAKVTNDAEVKAAQVISQAVVKYEPVKKKVKTDVAKIKADPTLTPAQKDTAISGVYIDQLWQGFCAVSNGTNSNCVSAAPSEPAAPAADAKALTASETPDGRWNSHADLVMLTLGHGPLNPIHEQAEPTRTDAELDYEKYGA